MIIEASEALLKFGHRYFTERYEKDFINDDLKDKYNIP